MTSVSGVSGVSALHTRPLYDSTDSLLRFAMRADGTLTGACGLAVAFLADPLASLTGLTSFQEYAIGATFVLAGFLVFSLAAFPDLRRLGTAIVVANVVLTMVALVVAETAPLSAGGVTATLAGGVYSAAFAGLQYLGLRRLEP